MKKYPILIVSLCCLAGAVSAQSNGYFVNFNGGSSDLTGNFVKPYNATPITNYYTWGEDVGVGGSGGLNVVDASETSNKTIYYNQSFDLQSVPVGQVITSTTDFLWSNSTATTFTGVFVGFNDSMVHNIIGNNNTTGGRIMRNNSTSVNLVFREAQSNINTLTFNQADLSVNSWYRLSYSLTKTGAAAYNYEVALYSLGASGLDTPELFTFGVDDDPALISGVVGATGVANLNKDTLYFGYHTRNDDENGISHLDNFAVVIPEPGTYAAIFGVAVLGAVLLLRRRQG